MAIYTGISSNNPYPLQQNSKPVEGGQGEFNQLDAGWQRNQSLLTPQQLRNEYLFGIPLQSRFPDPLTGQVQVMSDELLKELIDNAMMIGEQETGIRIMPLQIEERHAWDRKEYLSMGYMKLRARPIHSIERVDIETSDGQILYLIPQDWVDVGMLEKGQLNIVPLTTIALTGMSTVQPTSNGAAAFLNLMATSPWVPQFWKVKMTVGFWNGFVPKYINQYLAHIAAIRILSMLQATWVWTSESLGIDALSESKSGPGPQVYQARIEQLEKDKAMLIGKIKARYGLKLFSSNV